MQAGVDWNAMQLFNRMHEAADVMPSDCRTMHEAELLQRHHAVDFSVTGTVSSVCHSMHSLPQHQWGAMQLSSDRVLICHGGCVRQDVAVNIPHYVPQAEFVSNYLSKSPAYSMPCLNSTVYPVASQGSTVHANAVNSYLSNGVWVQAHSDGGARVSSSSAQLNIVTRSKPQVSVHGSYGLHAVFYMHEPPRRATATLESDCLEQPVEDLDQQPPAETEGSQVEPSEGKVRFHPVLLRWRTSYAFSQVSKSGSKFKLELCRKPVSHHLQPAADQLPR